MNYIVNYFATHVTDYGALIKAQSLTGTSSNYNIRRTRK